MNTVTTTALNASSTSVQGTSPSTDERMSKWSSIPFFMVHAACFLALYTGATWVDVAVCIGLYYFRMWGITTGFHRYFSHRSFKTGRVFQFVLALAGTLSAQKGVLWWAAHHRHHHRESDMPADIHSPAQKGFWWSHVGWILCRKYDETRFDSIKDFARFPELRWLNTFHIVPPILLAVALYFIGGLRMLTWGFFISTTLLWHGTFTINSLSHVFGKRRYKTTDTSRNNWLLALITMGEGWHNNHHYHQNTANQGWFWWEIDASFYTLKVLSWLGIVSDLKTPSDAVKYAHLKYTPEARAALAAEGRISFGERARQRMQEALNAAKERLPMQAPAPTALLKK
jgi:stearoyl-CoA desaturase (delta-9 desaturase)